MGTTSPIYETVTKMPYMNAAVVERHNSTIDGGSLKTPPTFIHSKEMFEELPRRMPFRRARKRRVALAGWTVSAILGSIMTWTYLPPMGMVNFFPSSPPPPQTAFLESPRHFRDVFIFGDSYSSTMFDTSGSQPSEENPLGNSDNAKPVWVDYFTTIYNATKLQTYNLAVGGSTIDRDLVAPGYPTSTSLKQQVHDVFVPTYGIGTQGAIASFKSADTLFAIWFGINDIVLSAGQMQWTPLDRLFESYASSMETLYHNGARHFLFINIPPVDKVYRSYDTTTMRSDIDGFNTRLSSFRLQFQRLHKDASTLVFDVHSLYQQIILHADAYEQTADLKNVTDVCPSYIMDQSIDDAFAPDCGVPLSQYFWQNLHATAAVHNATAALIMRDCWGSPDSSPSGFCN